MNDVIILIANVLAELRAASLSIYDEASLRAVQDRYNMLFLGENFNNISSLELLALLKSAYDVDMTSPELNEILPGICRAMEISCSEERLLDDLYSEKPYSYSITLF